MEQLKHVLVLVKDMHACARQGAKDQRSCMHVSGKSRSDAWHPVCMHGACVRQQPRSGAVRGRGRGCGKGQTCSVNRRTRDADLEALEASRGRVAWGQTVSVFGQVRCRSSQQVIFPTDSVLVLDSF